MALNFYHFTPSAEKYGAIEPEPVPVKPQQGIGGDMLDSATAGLYNATGGILDMVGAKGFAKNFYGWADENIQEMSDRGQQAMSKSIVQKDEQGDWALGEGATDFDTWLLGFANMAGQFAPTMIPGAGAASLATKAGMGALGVNAARIGGYAAAGGSAATGQAMEEARQEVEAMPDGVLMQSERFKRLIGELDKERPGLDDDALWDAAKARLADQVATDVQTDPKVLIANYAASAIGDPIIGRALAGARIAKGALGSAAKGFAVEGTTEAAQAGVTKYGVNEALQPIDGRDAMQGVDVAAANEGIMGGLFGGVIGGTGGVWNRGASPEADQQMPADSGSVIAPSSQPVQPDPSMNLPPQVEQALAPEPSIQDIISQVKDPDAIQLESTNPALAEAIHGTARSAAARQLGLDSIISNLKEAPVAQPAIPQNENLPSIAAIAADGSSQSQGVPADEGRIEPRLTGFDRPTPTASEPIQFVPENLATDNNASEPGNTLTQPEAAPAQPVQVKGNGIPWPTAADAVRSRTARAVKKAGQKVEAVKVSEGWGWRVKEVQPEQQANQVDDTDVVESNQAPQIQMPELQSAPSIEAAQVQMKKSGEPFKSEKEMKISASYKAAAATGAELETVPVDGGFGFRVKAPVTTEKATEITSQAPVATNSDQAKLVTLKDGKQITTEAAPAPKAFSPLVRMEHGEPIAIIAKDKKGNEIGRLTYMPDGGPIDVFVSESERRKGVATALYDELESRGGKVPPQSSGVAISKDAEAFRANRSGLQARPTGSESIATTPAADLSAEQIDAEWTAFADDSGTLKIPRAEMPQIKAEHRGAMTQFLKARGITHEQASIPAAELKPTQAEFSPSKVLKAMGFDGGDRSILVSSDGYVLDGHHQWLAKRENGANVEIIKFDAPISKLVEMAREFPSSTVADGAGQQEASNPSEVAESAPKAPADAGVSVSEPTETINDFGEKLGGARKDVWGGFSDAINSDASTAELPLSKAFPEPDYVKMAADGVPMETLAIIAAMRAEIPTKPRVSYKAKRWAEKVDVLRSFARDLIGGELTPAQVIAAMSKGGSELQAIADAIPAIAQANPETIKLAAKYRLGSGTFSMFQGQDYRPAKTFYFPQNGRSDMLSLASDNKKTALENLVKLIKAEAAANPDTPGQKQSKISVYQNRLTKQVYLGWEGGSGVLRIQNFDSIDQAREALKNNRPEIEEKLKALKATPDERRPENRSRVGIERFAGSVTPAIFADTFGFRGVEFGNYVEQSKRQQDLNEAYDALMDLADVLGVPPKALALNGELGIAFGARGKGGQRAAKAHYERSHIAINMTKESGAGSLAHEWWHAVDNYFARMIGKPDSMATDGSAVRGPEMRKEVRQAFSDVMSAINSTGVVRRSSRLDERRSKPYWSTTSEASARSFEAFIISELESKGFNNDYLANILEPEAWNALEEMQGNLPDQTYPYPTKAEQATINPAFSKLFDTLQTKETDKGTMLFSKTKSPSFKAWFGNSKVVDDNGEPMIVYHGTAADFSEFAKPKAQDKDGRRMGMGWGKGKFYFADSGQAASSAAEFAQMTGRGKQQNVMPVYLKIEKPIMAEDYMSRVQAEIEKGKTRDQAIAAVDKAIRREGFDGIIDTASGGHAVFEPTQIKSAVGNNGDFDSGNPDVRFATANTIKAKPAKGISSKLAKQLADSIMKRLNGAAGIKVVVLETQAEAEALWQMSLDGDLVRGAFDAGNNTAYIIAENIRSADELRTTLAHEVIGHGGLKNVISPDQYKAFIDRLTQTRSNKYFAGLWKQIDRDYEGVSEQEKGEELFAYYVQNQPVDGPVKFWWNAMKRWLHKALVSVGLAKAGDPDLDLMDDMIESIRAGFMFKRNAAKAGPDNTEPTELAFSKATRAEAVTGAINDVIGRKRLDPNDPYAVENRRLREQDRTLWDKAKQVFMRNFAPGGMLPRSIFDAKITRDGELESGELAIKHLILALERAVQKDTGKDINSQSDEFIQMTADALTGKVDNKLGAETKAALVAMRQYIDALSGDYLSVIQAKIDELTNRIKQDDKYPDKVKALNEIDLYEKIKGNMGVYVNRSYRAFDDPKWFQKVPVETINRARDYLRNQYKSQGDEQAEASRKAEVTLNKILKTDTAYDSMASFIAESKLGAKDLSTLIARKDISPEIRELLGEYKDPRMNFAKTATKMARLVWNSRFLNKVKADGVGVFFFDEDSRPAEATVQIAGDQSKTYEPLNGYWTFPEVAEALQDSLGTEQMEAWYEAAVKLTSIVKYGKTVLSPTTAMRNWQSAMFFAVANGHFDFKHMKKSMAAFREQVTQNAKGDDLAYLKKLKKLGVVYDAPYAGEMMQLLADSKIDEWLEGRKGKVFGTARQVNNLAQGFYSFGDDFWKIIGFENEKANFIKAGLTEAEAEKTAAERIRNTYPTYSMVGRAIKKLARFPLMGTFVSFPAEIIRTTANMLRYAAEDMKSDNPKIRAMARKRLTGMALVSGLFYALSAMTAAMLGIGDDEEEAIRDVGPSWQKNSTFLFYGRDDKGKLQYFDISFLDPYGYFKRPITALLRDQPWEDAAASGAADMLSPFFGADITAGTFFQVFANKKQSGGKVYNEYADGTDQLVSIADHIWTGLRPGFVNNAMGIFNAATGVRREGSGKEYDLGDEMIALLGWRASSLDAPTSIYYRSFEFGDQLSAANSTLNKVLRSDNKVSDEDIADAKETAQRQYDEAFKQMQRIVESGRAAGMTKEQVYKTLKLSGISSKNISGLIYGKTPPMQAATLQTQAKAVAKAREIRGDEQASEVLRRFQIARQLQ